MLERYSVEDFIMDDDFVQWVLHPTAESTNYWEGWIQSHPKGKEALRTAKALVINLSAAEVQYAAAGNAEEDWERIQEKIGGTAQTKNVYLRVLRYAAAVLLFVSVALWLLPQAKVDENLGSELAWITEENMKGLPHEILLPDGSKVILEPYSSLKYPASFSGKQRDVFLKGEAFFDVTRDTTMPFLIYANETITKVLGTSFTIRAFDGDDDVEVIVKTGRVAVYATVAGDDGLITSKKLVIKADEDIVVPLPNRKLEISPNQSVVFNRKKRELVKGIAPIPTLIESKVREIESFAFDNAPVINVFETLTLVYGVEINFSSTHLLDCTITTNLTDMPLIDKVTVICHALSLMMEEKDGEIHIYGEGCHWAKDE